MAKVYFGAQKWGWYAYAENGVLVIGEDGPHEGGDVYHGDYKGDDTPFLLTIKKDCPKIYNKIVKYFEESAESRNEIHYLSDMERLKKVFAACIEKGMDSTLYYAILAVVDETKSDEALDYFKSYAREYLV